MEGKSFSKVFIDVYYDLLKTSRNEQVINVKSNLPIIENPKEFENALGSYIASMMGYRIYKEYLLYRNGNIPTFDHFGEARKYFENIIVNASREDMANITEYISIYQRNYLNKFANHPLTEIFINAAKKTLSKHGEDTYISNIANRYAIGKLNTKRETNMPDIIIQDIDNFEKILEDFIESIKNNDTFFKRPIETMEESEAYENIFFWTLRNATALDLSWVEKFYIMFTNFVNDNTFENYRKHPVKLGDFLGDEVYLLVKKSTVAYETPYYLSFMLKDNRIELPNIRMGISNNIAYILATQTSQDVPSNEKEKELSKVFKNMLPKSKYFREYNPSHLVSLVMTLGFLKGYGIDTIRFPDYLPLRYQRFVIEEAISEEKLDEFQHRLTNKFSNNFMRLIEFSRGIEIASYPENGNVTEIHIDDNLTFNNAFLQKLYILGYSSVLAETKERLKKCRYLY